MTRIGMALDPRPRHVLARRRQRRRLVAEVLIGVVATAQLAAAGWVITQRSVSTVVQVEDLLAEVRTDSGTSSGDRDDVVAGPDGETGLTAAARDDGGVPPPAAEVPDDEAPTSQDPGAAPDDEPAAGAATAPDPETEPDAAAAAGPAAPAFVRPAEGVYAYRSEGYESISLGGARHDYPEETFAIIDHEDGCRWTFDHRVLEEKRTVNTYCSDGPVQSALAYDGYLTFYGSTAESHYTCDGGTRADLRDDAGATHTGVCTDGESTTRDTVTFVGRDVVDVGGQPVEALHYRIDTEVDGDIKGTSVQEVWVRPGDALLVRLERDTRTSGREFGAQVNYEEHAIFHLASLTPRS